MPLKKISNSKSLVNKIIIQLSQAILEGNFKPGDRLYTEAKLCEKLGVGRNSLREALKMLNAIGVLETRRGQGTFLVKEIPHNMFNPLVFKLILEPTRSKDVYQLRVLIESIIMLIAIKKATAQDINNMNNCISNAKILLNSKKGTIDDFVDLDIQFHKIVAEATHNHLIEIIWDTIMSIFRPFIKKALSINNGINISIADHRQYVEIIQNKQNKNIIPLVEKFLSNSINDIEKTKL